MTNQQTEDEAFVRWILRGAATALVLALLYLGWVQWFAPHSPDLQENAPQDHKSEKVANNLTREASRSEVPPKSPKELPPVALRGDKALWDQKSAEGAVRTTQTLSEVSKPHEPQPIDPKPYPLVGPSDENWLAALRIDETKENDWNVSDVGKPGGPSKGCYAIQEGRWNDALDRLGIDHDDPEWSWDLWYWCRPKAEYVLYSYWARFKLKTWEQRIKAHKGIKGIDNPSREVYYQRVKNIAWDLMRRKKVQ